MSYDKREGVIYLDCFTESDKKSPHWSFGCPYKPEQYIKSYEGFSFNFGGEILLSDIAHPSGHHKSTIHAAVSFR